MANFKDLTTKVSNLQNSAKADEFQMLISFAEFSHNDSPDNQKLHKKMNAALHEVCKLNWRNILLKHRHDLGGFEEIPLKQIKNVTFPNNYNGAAWVMCCGQNVGRLIGYIENTHSRTIFRPLKLDTFKCYKHN